MTSRVAVYARYASSKQNDVSIEDPFAMTDAYAAKQGWTVTARISSRARTGKNAHRPGLMQMFADLRAGAFDAVLVFSIDRLSRNLGDTLRFHDLFLFQRVELHSVLPEGKQDFTQVQTLGLAAQMTSKSTPTSTGEQIQKRIVNMLRNEGRITALPYGYRKLDTATGVNRSPFSSPRRSCVGSSMRARAPCPPRHHQSAERRRESLAAICRSLGCGARRGAAKRQVQRADRRGVGWRGVG